MRLADKRLLQRVEDNALRRILRGELDETAAHPADRDTIVEEQRPRVRRGDPPPLHAVGIEDHDLRFHGHVQSVEHGSQIAGRPIALQHDGAVAHLLRDLAHRVVRRLRIGNRRMPGPIRKRAAQRAFVGGA